MNEGKIFLFQQSHRKFFLVHRTKIIKKFSLFARQKSSKSFSCSQDKNHQKFSLIRKVETGAPPQKIPGFKSQGFCLD